MNIIYIYIHIYYLTVIHYMNTANAVLLLLSRFLIPMLRIMNYATIIQDAPSQFHRRANRTFVNSGANHASLASQ